MEEIKEKGAFQKSMEAAAGAVSFSRVLLLGLLSVLGVVVVLSFVMAYYQPDGVKNSEVVLSYFKDIAMMIVTALASGLNYHAKKEEPKP
jgi:hypothetical protein